MNGFWTAKFGTPLGTGYGVAYFTETEVFGGDAGFTYLGTYEIVQSDVTAKLRISPFAPGVGNVFGGNQAFDLTIMGKLQGNQLSGSGKASHAPQLGFQISLTKVK